MSQIYSVSEFPEVVRTAGFTYEIVPRESLQWPRFGLKETIEGVARPIFGQMGGDGGCIIYESKNIALSQDCFDKYCDHQKAIYAKANVA